MIVVVFYYAAQVFFHRACALRFDFRTFLPHSASFVQRLLSLGFMFFRYPCVLDWWTNLSECAPTLCPRASAISLEAER